ncbi:MAG: MMPL family transporter [Candidatus Nanopelagicaceae bacterium]|nr:MMPL family transporter [Candidatus Nanopelagicaceae bacterium]
MSQTTHLPAPKSSKRAFRRPFWSAVVVIFIWFGASGVFGPLFSKLSTVQENNNSSFLPDNAESTKASQVIARFSVDDNSKLPTLVLLEGNVDASKLAAINAHLATLPTKHINYLDKYKGTLDTGIELSQYFAPGASPQAFPAPDGKAILLNLPVSLSVATATLPDGNPAITAMIKTIRDDMNKWGSDNGFVSHVTGIGALISDLFGAFGGIDSSLLFTTLGVVSFILIIVYRSPVLWVLPLVSAIFALSTAGGVIYLLAKSNVIDLNGQAQGILTILVLGAATDYALLLIARYREELHHHESRFDAMRAAYRGIFEPILASGTTVAISLMVLLLSDLSSNRGLGPVGAIGIVAAMLTILTLLPALLVIFGRWIFWPRIPRFDDVDANLSGVWAKVGAQVSKRPRRLWISTAVLLVVLAGFATTLQADGLSTSQSFTTRPESVVGQDLLLKHFPGGEGQPTEVIVKESLMKETKQVLLSVNGVASVEPMRASIPIPGQPLPDIKVVDGLVVLNVTLTQAPDSVKARESVPVIRAAVHKIDSTILVGGSSAVSYDIDQASRHDNRLIIPVVLVLIGIILTLLLRSFAAAGLLLATVVLSYAATLGVCQLVFHNIFHFSGADTSFPLFAFVFLVALGIDYNIFLMTRVREESAKIGTRAGVIKGLTVTGGVITSAGIVLAATFGVLGILPLVFLAELGFAVGFGVLLDTIIVRSILVPALVRDIGGKVWWPSKLQHRD